MNNREIAEYTLERLQKAGAHDAQVLVAHGSADELNIDGGEFSLMRTLFDTDISIKVVKDGRKGVTSINQTDKESIDAAVASVIASADSGVADEAERIAPFEGKEHFTDGVLEPDTSGLYDRMDEFMKSLKSELPKILVEQFICTYSRSNSLFMNTNGTEFSREKGNYSVSSMFSAHEGDKASSFNGYGAYLANLDVPLLDLDMHRTLLRESELSLNTRSVDGKFVGPIIITPACLEEFIMEALGNFASDSFIVDKTSRWLDKIGKPVASDSLTVSMNPLDPRIVCGERFTATGFKSENYDVIKDGVLQCFMLSDYAARKSGFARAKNTSHSTIIAGGNSSLDSMIAGIERGLIVNRFSGGSPSLNGDFSGVAKNSFMIENGKVTDAVSETMISGNLAELLQSVRAISRETASNGGGISPWMAFDGVTVSGK